jgi:hypothetical protein
MEYELNKLYYVWTNGKKYTTRFMTGNWWKDTLYFECISTRNGWSKDWIRSENIYVRKAPEIIQVFYGKESL